MKILVAQIVGYGTIAKSLMLEKLQEAINMYPNDEIYYLTCSNSFNVCYYNPKSVPHKCYLCRKGVENSLSLIEGDFKHITINDINSLSDLIKVNQFNNNVKDINRDVFYEDFNIGLSVISSYISKTRDRDLEKINTSTFAKNVLLNSAKFYSGLTKFCMDNDIQKIYNFNGRIAYNNAVMAAANSLDIPLLNIDIPRVGSALEEFQNVLPHNIKFKQNLIENSWDSSPLSEKEKIDVSNEYFNKRRSGTKVNLTSFTKQQLRGELPAGINFDNKTTVLYTSSDDEFAAIGDEFNNPYFKDQNEGIFYVARVFSENFPEQNLIIRIHPNFAGVEFEYAKRINSLKNKYKNVYIVEPESKVDSYALMDIAEKIITFGSSITTEATYWEKPVIMLGRSFFSGMEIAYEPDRIEDLEKLIKNPLPPKPKIGSIKFGYYLINGGIQAKYYNRDNSGKTYFKGKQLFFYSTPQKITAKIIQLINQYVGVKIFVKNI